MYLFFFDFIGLSDVTKAVQNANQNHTNSPSSQDLWLGPCRELIQTHPLQHSTFSQQAERHPFLGKSHATSGLVPKLEALPRMILPCLAMELRRLWPKSLVLATWCRDSGSYEIPHPPAQRFTFAPSLIFTGPGWGLIMDRSKLNTSPWTSTSSILTSPRSSFCHICCPWSSPHDPSWSASLAPSMVAEELGVQSLAHHSGRRNLLISTWGWDRAERVEMLAVHL